MDPIKELDIIFNHSFMTGSRVFNSERHPDLQSIQDWDIVVPGMYRNDYAQALLDSLPGSQCVKSDYFAGVTITAYHDVLHINLIPTMQNDYRAWYYATLAFRDMWQHTEITNKEHKIAIFEALRASFRGRLPEIRPNEFISRCQDIAKEARLDTLFKFTTELFTAVNRLQKHYESQH